MRLLTEVNSQVNNIRLFSKIFPLSKTIKRALTLPFDYYFRSGRASVYPLNITFLVTLRCNAHCKMCAFQEITNANIKELTIEEIKNFIKDISIYKPSIFLSGGEPFMRKDIFEIIDVIRRHDLTCGICTNGLFLDKERAKELVRLNVSNVLFSLHGTEPVHDAITKIPGSYKKLVNNIGTLTSYSRRPKVILNCAISEDNYQFLEDVIKIGKSLKVDIVRFEHLVFLTFQDIKRHSSFCQIYSNEEKGLSPNTYMHDFENYKMQHALYDIMHKIKARYKNFVIFKPLLRKHEIKAWYSNEFANDRRCFFIWGSLFIYPNGDIAPCQFYPGYKLGNVKRDSIAKVWNSKKYRNLRLILKNGPLPGCKRCCKL